MSEGHRSDAPPGSHREAVARVVDGSRVIARLQYPPGVARNSRLASVASRLVATTEYAIVYRWFTRDRESEPVVVDLGATYSLGPLVRGIDRAGSMLAPAWRTSRLKPLTERTKTLLVIGSDSQTVRLFTRLLEAPEPRERKDEEQE